MVGAWLSGLALGFSLIVAIGAQNAFVLRQGLRREHVFAVCLVCAVSDALLIILGVSSFHTISQRFQWLEPALRFGGSAFLIWYGIKSLKSAISSNDTLVAAGNTPVSLGRTLAICLALTWLNPHVYLDTVVMLGVLSTRYPGNEKFFAAGAICASFIFFFTLGFGARLLRPVFENPKVWRIFEGAIAVLMWIIAAQLLWPAISELL